MDCDFNRNDIIKMNENGVFQNCILNIKDILKIKNGNNTYHLYATGFVDCNGRKYVALPSNVKLTSTLKSNYNLI